MSEVEKTSSMDKKNTLTRPLGTPSKSGNENNGSVCRFPGSYQKRDFGHNGSVPNESVQSKKYYQGREKVNIKENSGRKFSSNQRRDFEHGGTISNEFAQSKKCVQNREKDSDRKALPEDSSGGNPRMGWDGRSKKGGICSNIQGWNEGWKLKHYYPRHCAKTPYSKEQFLQANCQFVVRQNGDYSIHANNPDTLVDWDLVEQVRIFDHEVPSCPICLYPPKAAKITRCGHSYCWPCMLHYMSLCEGNYVNCPICYGRVREKDLKSVVALQTTCFSVGQEITMKLMKKCRGQTLVSPRPVWTAELGKPFCVTDKENNMYAKLLTADLEYTENILHAERQELLLLYQEDSPDTLEGSFVTAALKLLEERALKLTCGDLLSKEQIDADLQHGLAPEASSSVFWPAVCLTSTESVNPSRRYVSAFSDEEEQIVEEIAVAESGHESADQSEVTTEKEETKDHDDITASSDSCLLTEDTLGSESSGGKADVLSQPKPSWPRNRREKSDAAYFYQSADGQHIYMQGINISCLKAQYSDISNCPDEVTARIIDLERIFMDTELRKKYRWLNHLPLTCEFMMVELELQPPLISQDVLDMYSDEILKRRNERERKQQYDNKRTQRIQNEECRKMGIDPHSRIVRSDFRRGVRPSSISSMDTVFQSLGSVTQEYQPDRTSSHLEASGDAAAAATESGMSKNVCSSEESSIHTVPSFAQMLKMGSPKPASFGIVGKSSKTAENQADSKLSDSDGEEAAHAPEYRNVFDFDIAMKLAELDCAASAEEPASEPSAGGKKKKKAKKLLFTSGHMLNHKR